MTCLLTFNNSPLRPSHSPLSMIYAIYVNIMHAVYACMGVYGGRGEKVIFHLYCQKFPRHTTVAIVYTHNVSYLASYYCLLLRYPH